MENSHVRPLKVKKLLGFSYAGSLSALVAVVCCVLPMVLILLGLGGSGLAIIGALAASSYYVLTLSTLLVALAWAVAWRRGSVRRLQWWLGGSSMISVLAWGLVAGEARINDYLITLM